MTTLEQIESMNFKEIHMGNLIYQYVTESGIELSRICKFLKCTEEEIKKMYASDSLDTKVLLRWSKLLGYDFFRLYSQHLILYAPQMGINYNQSKAGKTKLSLPQFRKNIYTRELIDFILEQITAGEMTKLQVMEQYHIPKTTLYKWMNKYRKPS